VRAVIDAGFEVTTAPGPTALVTALVTSGLPTGRFVFEGFLPRSGRAREQRLADLAGERRTIVVYEAPHRVVRTLADLAAALGGDRPVVVARELTKLWETTVRGTLGDVELGEPRGEYVLVVAGAPDRDAPPDDDAIRLALRAELAGGATTRDAAAAVARRLGVPKRLVYALAVSEGHRSGTIEE
jgi:16S rRNA (cytidine1402-2'-O)-methyltransferase